MKIDREKFGLEFYTEAEMADILNIHANTLKRNRCIGTNHPPFKKIGRMVIYPKQEYLKWIQAIPLTRAVAQ